jgi:hypothetical protein
LGEKSELWYTRGSTDKTLFFYLFYARNRFIVDMSDFEDLEQLTESLLSTLRVCELMQTKINEIILNDEVTQLRYILTFPQFEEEFLSVIERIYDIKGQNKLPFVKSLNQNRNDLLVQSEYEEGRLQLRIVKINENESEEN